MKYLIFALLLVFIAGFNSCGKPQGRQGTGQTQSVKYRCPMHPNYISDKPGTCPICGMQLVPFTTGGDSSTGTVSNVPGQSIVDITPEKEQLIGVKFAKVASRNLEIFVRAAGKVARDPDLYSAIVDYQQAFSALKDLKSKNSQQVDSLKEAESLLASAEMKLRHMGLSEGLIARYSKTIEPPMNLIMSGTKGGTVWIYAQVYENEAGLIKEGQLMEAASSAIPGEKFRGNISSVDLFMDNNTRSLRVRAEVPDPKGLLKPDMFVDAVIHVELGLKTAVPEDSIIDTGTRQLVFVHRGKGKYEPRQVRAGRHAEGYYEILSGVSPGDEVVTSANFLIDSESKLKSAVK